MNFQRSTDTVASKPCPSLFDRAPAWVVTDGHRAQQRYTSGQLQMTCHHGIRPLCRQARDAAGIKDHARRAAIFDALSQTDARQRLEKAILVPLAQSAAARRVARAQKAATTEVDFFKMGRLGQLMPDNLSGGFANTAPDAVRCFCAIQDAMAHPQRSVTLGGAAPPAPASPAVATVLLMLTDATTPLHLARAPDCATLRDWLRFQTGAQFAGSTAADFAVST